jgi:indolepyruvate ferredoxin oxidoreductase beta subunit
MSVTNVLIAGVGGQGAILSSELLALTAVNAGFDVKQGEFHGVAQRGGAVFSHVRFGDKVFSPVARRESVDFMLALEELEALRYAHFVKPGGTIIMNEHTVEPVRTADHRDYPSNAAEFLKSKGFNVIVVNATQMAIDLGNHRAANVVLLGALAALLSISDDVWNQTLNERIPERFMSLNLEAFKAGRAETASAN